MYFNKYRCIFYICTFFSSSFIFINNKCILLYDFLENCHFYILYHFNLTMFKWNSLSIFLLLNIFSQSLDMFMFYFLNVFNLTIFEWNSLSSLSFNVPSQSWDLSCSPAWWFSVALRRLGHCSIFWKWYMQVHSLRYVSVIVHRLFHGGDPIFVKFACFVCLISSMQYCV